MYIRTGDKCIQFVRIDVQYQLQSNIRLQGIIRISTDWLFRLPERDIQKIPQNHYCETYFSEMKTKIPIYRRIRTETGV